MPLEYKFGHRATTPLMAGFSLPNPCFALPSGCGLALALVLLTGCVPGPPGVIPQPAATPQIPAPRELQVPPTWPGWTNLLGPDLTSCSPETGLRIAWGDSGPPVLWRTPLGEGYSAPVAAGEDLILCDRQGDAERLTAFDIYTGKTQWQIAWPTSYRCQYAYSSGPYATPRIDGDLIFAAGAQGQLHCVGRDGRIRWRRLLAEEFSLREGLFGFGPGLQVDSDRLYLNLGAADEQAGVVALDKRTGATLWRATDHASAYTMPQFFEREGKRRLLVLTEWGLVGLDPASGKQHFEYEFHPRGSDSINAVSPVVADGWVILMIGPGPGAVGLELLDPDQLRLGWKDRRVLDSQFNSLVVHAGHIYGFTASRQGGALLRCIELKTGKLCWSEASDLGRGQLLAADGKLLALGEQGHLAALDLSPAAPVWRGMTAQPLLKGPCYSQPALHRGLLYVRNEQELICFDLREPRPASSAEQR